MKIYTFALPLICSLFFSHASLAASGREGGGGQSVVCRDSSGRITSAQLLDLYEAEKIYGLSAKTLSGSLPSAVEMLKSNLVGSMQQPEFHLFPLIDRSLEILKLVDSSVVLTPVNDAGAVIAPKNCQIEQLANYVSDDLLLVSKEIWDALDLTNQAALILHEGVYRQERYYGATDSNRARKIVGHVASGFKFDDVKKDLPPGAKLCMATQGDRVSYQFAYYPNSRGDMTKLQFYVFEGLMVFSKKTAVVPVAFPWSIKNVHCGAEITKGCNFTGGDTTSNFEGNDFVTVGAQKIGKRIQFYIDDSKGRHNLDCSPEK